MILAAAKREGKQQEAEEAEERLPPSDRLLKTVFDFFAKCLVTESPDMNQSSSFGKQKSDLCIDSEFTTTKKQWI